MSRFMTIFLPSLSRGQSFPHVFLGHRIRFGLLSCLERFFLLFNVMPDMGLCL